MALSTNTLPVPFTMSSRVFLNRDSLRWPQEVATVELAGRGESPFVGMEGAVNEELQFE